MLVPEHIEQLIQTVQQHLEQQRKPISEHELLVKLAKQGVWNNVTKGSAILQQFQKHFLTMHALYRLQTRLGDSNCRLHISPVSIYLQRPDEEMEDLDPDQELEICEASDTHLREYYLDLNHLVAANDASVADLLGGFWHQYNAWQKQEDAYSALDLPLGSDWTAVQAAYRRKAATSHPDKGGNAQAFQAVQTAYDSLKRILRPAP